MTLVDPSLSKSSSPAADDVGPFGPLAAGIAAGALIALFVTAFHYGRDAQANAQRAEAATVEQETRSFCTGLGIPPGTDAYVRCENGLAAIRLRLEQRLAAEAAGLL
jgi:hypothetical protein